MAKFYYKRSFRELLEEIDCLPSRNIEIYFVPGDEELFNDEDNYKIINEHVDDLVIHAAHFSHGLNPSSEDKKVREETLKYYKVCVDIISRLGYKYIILHSGIFSDTEDYDLAIKRNIEVFSELAKYSEGLGVEFLVENLVSHEGCSDFSYITYNIEGMKRILSVLDKDRFSVVFDFGHAIITAVIQSLDYKEYIDDYIDAFRGRIKHFHVFDGDSGSGKDKHLMLGKGDFDLAFIGRKIREFDDARITFEINPNNYDNFKKSVGIVKGYIG